MPVLSNEFLDIQATLECALTLICLHDMIRTYSVKNLSALFCKITSKYEGNYYCLNCKNHEYYCNIEMPKEERIWKYNHGEKSKKIEFIIYADTESLLEKISICHNNLGKVSITKINKHTACGYSLFTYCSFDAIKNKYIYYKGKDCMKNLSRDQRKYATKINSYEREEMIPLTNKEYKAQAHYLVVLILFLRAFTIVNTKVENLVLNT